MNKFLYIIPARGGSKGIPHKNIKRFNGKELIRYSIEAAKAIADDEDICVSTDDDGIISVVENAGLKVPFKRPDYLATDSCGTHEVLLHAIEFYEALGRHYDAVVLLQPTSPFRKVSDIENSIKLYNNDIDMVVSVNESSSNPFFNAYTINDECYLTSLLNKKFERRQDAPTVYEYNGAVYVMNIKSLKEKKMKDFTKVIPYIMDEISSLDLDTPLDWAIAEAIAEKKLI
jgi:CMP-N-acetylneuraminic acid synthetase